ncbi:MAG: bifunctional 4-hydroxy-2-oxoglutarate aldolase/2-dehydro-3-deoxy-phosphogluconate aldolase [Opitutaceae bacterium]|jgi:2-dehydro-3-deoxyphosphogluconate aldolase/(4S)-4-hydroxy-2-oxoglutarate aldolase|nr:bifunctional 4-hydroxy-2-oxoglutarate aldolase/2-dehydro-3-deoxy-phosphogluconate aldolase [Opitutaceae bacterium]
MSDTVFNAVRFAAMPLIAILRGQPEHIVEPVVQALSEGGFTALEITMNSPGAVAQIRAAVAHLQGCMDIGAGTVTTLAELDEAASAGASFIVTPVIVPDVIGECVRRGLPVFPGAFTPTEVHQAHRLGATMVKLFPAHRLGPGYVRDLKAPLSSVRLLATGGITPETLPEYVHAGAEGFGLGSPLLAPERLAAGDWAWLQRRAESFCEAWKIALTPGG